MDEETYGCPVCFSDGAESGKVIVSTCSHHICVNCYSNMIVRKNVSCPVCRTPYNISFVAQTATPEITRETYVNFKVVLCNYTFHLCRFRVR